jgi:hypothetical protein
MTGLIIITAFVFCFALTFAVAAIMDELSGDSHG